MKKDPTIKQTDRVGSFSISAHLARSGRATWKVDVVTEYRSFSYWVMREPDNIGARKTLEALMALGGQKPETITYQKDRDTNFFRVFGYNRPHDEPPK